MCQINRPLPVIFLLTLFSKNNTFLKLAVRALPIALACNYFAFRVELFEEEYEKNNPVSDVSTGQVTFSAPTLNWETFDKDNAPKAVKVEPWISLVLLAKAPEEVFYFRVIPRQYQLIRDKSPPSPDQVY